MTAENIVIDIEKTGEGASSSIAKLSKNVDGLKESASKSTGALGKLAASIKRIAFYRVLRSALKNVTKAFDEGLKNAYHFSEAVGYRLAATMDTIATKSLTMKNQMGAAFGGLIQAVEPILLRIISLITQAANAIAAFFGAFNGGEYLRAKDTAVAWDDANKSAGAYKRTILGFDEINRLDSPSGGGGSKIKNWSEMFEVAKTPEWMTELTLGIKDVLFNWKELNSEQIMSKLFLGLGAATGGVIGFALGGIKGALVGSILGIVLGATISSLIFDFDGRLSGKEILKSIVGALAIVSGGIIGATVGGIAGAAVGIAIGAAVAITIGAISLAIDEKKKKKFYETEIGKLEKQLKDDISENSVHIKEITAKVDALTGDIDKDTEIKLTTATKLIKQIFDLDSVQNKTPEQIALLKSKIETLNGLDLDGLKLSFNETTGRVNETRENVEALMESIREQYKLEALKDSVIEAYKLQTSAELELAEAEENLRSAQALREEKLRTMTDAENAFNKALDEYNSYMETGDVFTLAGAQHLAELKMKVDDAGIAWKETAKGIEFFDESVKSATENVNAAKDVLKQTSDKVDLLESKLQDITSKPYTITVNAVIADVAASAKAAVDNYGNGNAARWLTANAGKYASGGYPSRGDLFIAGEAGAEIVSSHGGQTQVSNTDQIAYSVQAGNGVVVDAIYAMANAIVSSVDRKDTSPVVTIGDRDVYRAWERGSSAVGGSLVHG